MKVSEVSDFFQKHSAIMNPIMYIFALIFINYAIPSLMNVFDIETSVYINYTMLTNALLLFYIMLPKKDFVF